jgi:CBS domain-containing protein
MTATQKATAGDIMRRALVFARPDQKLADVERMLVDHQITGMPVIENNKLVGIISGSDLARARVLAEAIDGQIRDELHWDETQADGFHHAEPEKFEGVGVRFSALRAKDVMRTQVITCQLSTPIDKIAKTLIQHRIHRIIVVDSDRPVGIITSLDLVRLLVGA